MPGLVRRLSDGAAVLDVGCGSGHAVRVAAQAFPRSRFTGLDVDAEQIAAARAGAVRLPNAEFVVTDAAELPAESSYDVVLAFDAIHDQRAPDEVLRRIRAALAPDGVFVMVDAKFSSHLANNPNDLRSPRTSMALLMFLLGHRGPGDRA